MEDVYITMTSDNSNLKNNNKIIIADIESIVNDSEGFKLQLSTHLSLNMRSAPADLDPS